MSPSGSRRTPSWTVLSLLKKAADFFAEQDIPNARLEAEILLAHTLAFDRVKLYAEFARPMETGEVDRFRALVQRRLRGEPSAYLTGQKEFFSLPFHVCPDVLIPRPETEEVVQLALEHLPGDGGDRLVADVGTGSGCIAVTLLKLKPTLRCWAVDIAMAALSVARGNAERHGVEDRIAFICGDSLHLFGRPDPPGPFSLICCNPPYVDPEGALPVDPEVVAHEPGVALFTPPGHPLFFYEKLLKSAAPLLRPGGLLIGEIGADLGDGVESLAKDLNWIVRDVRKDLAGIDRVIALAPDTGRP